MNPTRPLSPALTPGLGSEPAGWSWAAALLGLLGLLLGSGCAAYHLGPTNGLEARARSVQVRPFVNQTLEPRLTDALTSQMRKQLQKEGTFELATHDDGDIVLSGTITSYERTEVTFAPNDILLVRDFRVRMTAVVTARERLSGKLLLEDQPVSGFTLVRVQSNLTSSERQALPLLAADLARNLTALLADGKW